MSAALRVFGYPVLSWRARRMAVASAAPAAVVQVPEAGDVLVPRVSVRAACKGGCHGVCSGGCGGVEAVAELSDGLVTASGTAWVELWSYRYCGDASDGYTPAACRATEEAIQKARWLLAGAQAGHAAYDCGRDGGRS